MVTGPAVGPAIPLSLAILCVDCEAITTSTTGRCGVCGSPATMSVSKIINRTANELKEHLGAALTRIKILYGRMEAVHLQDKNAHCVSMQEVPGWIEEMDKILKSI